MGADGACAHVHWAVDARKLSRQDKQAVSPKFMVDVPELGPLQFTVVLHAKEGAVSGKKGAGFVKVKGLGRVMLKCESQLPEGASELVFRVGLGRDNVMQAFRGPVVRDFAAQSCHGLPTEEEEWDFSAAVDASSTFLVTVEIAPKQSFETNANVWWAPLVNQK